MGCCTLNIYVNVYFFYMHNRMCKRIYTKIFNNLYCIVSAIWSIKQMISFIHMLKNLFFFNKILIIKIPTQILHRVVGLRVFYCVISKLKFYSNNNYQKTLHFKSVLLFSSIFNQSVPPAAELDSTAPIYF